MDDTADRLKSSWRPASRHLTIEATCSVRAFRWPARLFRYGFRGNRRARRHAWHSGTLTDFVYVSRVRLVALVVGFGVSLFGVGVYQAWWMTAFALGGLSVALMPAEAPPVRGLMFGAAVTGAGLLAGMSIFLLYGAMWGATWWLLASVASVLAAVALALLASRLRRGAVTRDMAGR